MRAKTHIGITLNVLQPIFWYSYDGILSPHFMKLAGVCLIGSMFPDIDHPYSPIGKLFKPISTFIFEEYGHRKITHSIIGLILLSILLFDFFIIIQIWYRINLLPYLFFFIIGYLTHIVADMFTYSKLAILYPVFEKKIGIGLVSSRKSDIIIFPILLLIFMLGFYINFIIKICWLEE